MTTIDLSKCVPNQKLRSKHGWILTYVKPLDASVDYYDHLVKYHDGTFGTRINDGHTYRKPSSRLECDHDIVEILPIDSEATTVLDNTVSPVQSVL